MNVCPSCLKEGYETFCNPCLKKLFNGKKVSHILPFSQPEFNAVRLSQSERLSISGIQIKHSIKLEKLKLVLTDIGGEYILKPTPIGTLNYLEAIPANEHLTMQLASQLFEINIPPNAFMQFEDKKPAYIVKRFDVLPDGTKLLQEDFAQVAGKTEDNSGKNYKYDFSYEGIAELMKKYVNAYPIEIERFYSLVIFNYLVSNGDAHLKNFSVFRNIEFGDYILTPAYDLLNTSIHIPNEGDTALELFKDDFMTESFKYGTKYAKDDFYEFGIKIGISKTRIEKIYGKFLNKEKSIDILIKKSFLPDELKEKYFDSVLRRLKRLEYSFDAEK
ncbi:MAG: type II toxin-antitoxin system HipA family toxin [Ignavibacteriales bacterium]|nr:MAG: type II toxin-antitoxin system HipA family toxin [Ignavibacteriales bacterium]